MMNSYLDLHNRIGQTMRCIYAYSSWFVEGQEYLVTAQGIGDANGDFWFPSGGFSKFELVEDEPSEAVEDVPESLCAPTIAEQRKSTPVYSGVLKYFPLALQEVARCSKAGNDQHNPGEPLHWARDKSGDELDALTRHLLDAGTIDTDGVRHSTKVAWRALANLEKELEDLQCDPVE